MHLRLESVLQSRRLGGVGVRPPDEVLRRRVAVPPVQREDDRNAGTSQKHLQNFLLQGNNKVTIVSWWW